MKNQLIRLNTLNSVAKSLFRNKVYLNLENKKFVQRIKVITKKRFDSDFC